MDLRACTPRHARENWERIGVLWSWCSRDIENGRVGLELRPRLGSVRMAERSDRTSQWRSLGSRRACLPAVQKQGGHRETQKEEERARLASNAAVVAGEWG
jgi:hypothetical protein